MAFNKTILADMLEMILDSVVEKNLGPIDCRGLWPLAIMSLSHNYPRFSEYLTYANYSLSRTSRKFRFKYHPFHMFGRSAVRNRGGSKYIPELIKFLKTNKGYEDYAQGFAYEDFVNHANKFYKHCVTPSVIQLDHVFTDLPLPSRNRWNYYENYIYGCVGVTDKTFAESEAAKTKVLERMEFWWHQFEQAGCVFIHIPRNAGTSVEALFFPEEAPKSQHFTAVEFREDNFMLFNKLVKFCTVRNPYERLISAWQYLRAGGNQKKGDIEWSKELQKIGAFGDFIKKFFSYGNPCDWSSYPLPPHFVPQHEFICDEDDELLVDVCVEFKDFLKIGLKQLSRKEVSGRIVFNKVPHRRSSEKPKEPCVYDEETAGMVYEAYKKDFHLLNYSKDSWKKTVAAQVEQHKIPSPIKPKIQTTITEKREEKILNELETSLDQVAIEENTRTC